MAFATASALSNDTNPKFCTQTTKTQYTGNKLHKIHTRTQQNQQHSALYKLTPIQSELPLSRQQKIPNFSIQNCRQYAEQKHVYKSKFYMNIPYEISITVRIKYKYVIWSSENVSKHITVHAKVWLPDQNLKEFNWPQTGRSRVTPFLLILTSTTFPNPTKPPHATDAAQCIT